MMKDSYYVTTFCNKAHSLKTGRPVNHECHQLPIRALEHEAAGRPAHAVCVLNKDGTGPIVKGRQSRRKG
jgi:hypothetical protein